MRKILSLIFALTSFMSVSAETIEITCNNLKYYDYSYMGSIYFEAENNDYFISLAFFSDAMGGNFTTLDMWSGDTFITNKKTNEKISIEHITCSSVPEGMSYNVHGSADGADGNVYTFHLSYSDVVGEEITIDFTDAEPTHTYDDTSAEYTINAENNDYILVLDFTCSTAACQLFTANFKHDLSYLQNKATNEKIYFSEVEYLGTRNGDYIDIEATIKGSDNNIYYIRNLKLEEREIDIIGHWSLCINNAEVEDEIADYGYFTIKGVEGYYTVCLGAKTTEIEGQYRSKDFNKSLTWIEYGYIKNYFVTGGFSVEKNGDQYFVTGEMLADDGYIYNIVMSTDEAAGISNAKIENITRRKYLDNGKIVIETEKGKYNGAAARIY